MHCTFEDKNIFIRLNEDITHNEINCADNKSENSNNDKQVNNNGNNIIENNTEETFSWCDVSTKLFLCLYKEKRVELENRKIKTKKIMWQKISELMKVKGYNVTTLQAENKYKSLERSYKNVITNNKQTGRSRMSRAFQT